LAKVLRKDFDFDIKPSTIYSTFFPSAISSTYQTNNEEDNWGEAWASSFAHVVHDIYQSINSSTIHQLCVNKLFGCPAIHQDEYTLSVHYASNFQSCKIGIIHVKILIQDWPSIRRPLTQY